MSIVQLARPEIRSLHAYEAAEQVDDTIRLNANESPHRCAIGDFRRPLNRYPEVRPSKLQQALAERFGCPPRQLLVTRGSSEAIDLLIRTFCRAGADSMLVSSPSFSMYRHYAEIQGARVIEVPASAEQDFAIDVDHVFAACDETTRLIFICSPNNPTGTTLPRPDLERLLRERGDKSVVVVDEAYVEFGGEASVIELLDRFDNLVVLRTLSKALGLAGARCGGVAGPRPVIDLLNAVQAPYALATPVVECVEDALRADHLETARANVSVIVAERERLADALRDFDIVTRVWPSDANFLLVRFVDAAAVMRRCAAQKVLLRHFGGVLEDCIRISIGTREENDTLLRTLESIDGDSHG
ncbi:MAG: histidinol-phosphate transaminase [Woeseiaceae bacterium]|nr:histidinol-phosphate transaminase [Gammaproteobacteria bacterium]NNK25240.1 histidinol-phosphate transaminase [Woeseiaceae bacterium]